jgi:hypothetical protein
MSGKEVEIGVFGSLTRIGFDVSNLGGFLLWKVVIILLRCLVQTRKG